MSKRTVRLTESELKRVISESVRNILNEAYGQYEATPYNSSRSIDDDIANIEASVERDNIFKDNMKYFTNAFKTVARDFSIINTLKRSKKTGEVAQILFNVKTFLEYVQNEYGEDLYTTRFSDYEYEGEETADGYLENCVYKLREPGYDVEELFASLNLKAPVRFRKEFADIYNK
jgi:hypothetical protein